MIKGEVCAIKIVETHSVTETEQAGKAFAETIVGGVVIALYGGLGMGTTAFVRGMAQHLCPKAEVSSPTFAIVNDYGGQPPLVHFDMYRIGGWEDLETTGFFEYIDQGAVVVVEWSENIEGALPPSTRRVRFARLSDTERRIEMEESV